MNATTALGAPRYFFAPINETLIIPDPRSDKLLSKDSSLRNLGTAFPSHWAKSDITPLRDLHEVLNLMATYTIIVSNHAQGVVVQDKVALVDMRNFVQHRLLSLSPATKLGSIPDTLYESTRLAALAYALLVTFPIHGPKAPFAEIVSQLYFELSSLDLEKEKEMKLLMWTLVMGAIVGMNTAKRSWFVAAIRVLKERLGIEKWEGLREALGGFMWLGSTNNSDGERVWEEIKGGVVRE